MKKLYSLPISLLLLNPAFAEDIRIGAVSSEKYAVSLEEAANLPFLESKASNVENTALETAAIEIDPLLIDEIKSEISAILDKNNPTEDSAFDTEEIDSSHQEIASTLPHKAKKAIVQDEQEAAVDNEDFFQDEVASETPHPLQKPAATSYPSGQISRQTSNEDKQLSEKEVGSHVRRYSTKPSSAPQAQNRSTDSERQMPGESNPAPKDQKSVSSAAQTPKGKLESTEAPRKQLQKREPLRRQASQTTPKQSQANPSTAQTPKGKLEPTEAPRNQPQKRAPLRRQASQTTPKQSPSNPASQAQRPATGGNQRNAQEKSRAHVRTEKKAENNTEAPERKQMTQKSLPKTEGKAAVAAPSDQGRNEEALKQKKVAQNETQNTMSSSSQASMQQGSQVKKKGMMYNTAARPPVKEGYDVYLMGDVLLWQAAQENLTYIYSGDEDQDAFNRVLHTVDFDWDWGFRLGAGYNASRDGWDIALYWTHIRNTADGHEHSSSDKELFPVWGVAGQLFNGTINHAKANWRVHLDQVDLNLGREFYVGKFLTLRPFVGMRSDWIFQEYDVEMEGIANFTRLSLEQEAKLKNRFWGFGFAAGLDTDWLLRWGFSLYGNADMSLLMGFFDVDQKGTQNDAKIWDLDKSFRTGRAILDLGLGLKWARLFCKDRFGLVLKAGYEYHLYFNQNQFILSNGNDDFELFTPVNGDLTYQGVIGSIQFDF